MRVTEQHIATLRKQGFAVVERFLTADEVARALAGFHRVFGPTFPEYLAGKRADYSQNLFPWDDSGLNQTVLHPELISAAERIIGTRDIRLACSDINGRYATQEVQERFHVDFGNNTLGPELPEDFSNVTLALVLTEVRPGMAPTLMVPWGKPDSAAVPMLLPAGSLYMYSTMTTRHSASPFTAPEGLRATCWTIWSRKDRPWEGRGWTHKSSGPQKADAYQRLISEATPRQLEMIGFPPPGDPLWTPAYLAGMARRYPGFNTAPYLAALRPMGGAPRLAG